MNRNSFFSALENHYNSKLPFVVYSRPINAIIKCWMQQNDKLFTTKSYEESGFVFAPFDASEDSILIPVEKSIHSTLNIKPNEQLEVQFSTKSSEPLILDEEGHIKLLVKGISEIKKGSLNKVVLSRFEKWNIDTVRPLELFKQLYNTYKNAMVYCWYHPKVGLWLGATPELLFKVVGKELTTISLAGTQPYIEDEVPKWTAKEIEEQKIVTDFIVEQIKDYTSNINVLDTETVKAGNLMHLKTRIISKINSSSSLKNIIQYLHPTPAVCGFPKEASKAFILANENYDREFYTGFLGELNIRQTLKRNTNKRNVENNAYSSIKTISNFYVNLRCMQINEGVAKIYVGGGITKDSIPENEWEETVNKTKTIVNVLR